MGKGRESDWKYPFILRKSMNYLYVLTDINHYLSQLSASPAIDYRFIRPVYDSMIHACQIDLRRLLRRMPHAGADCRDGEAFIACHRSPCVPRHVEGERKIES